MAFVLIFVVLWQGGNLVLNAVGLTEQRWVLVEEFNLTNGLRVRVGNAITNCP